MNRPDKVPYYLKLNFKPNNFQLIANADLLMRWNIMERKPKVEQILWEADLLARQQRRNNLKSDIKELATTPAAKAICTTYVLQLTNNGGVDINDLPVDQRMKLTREGIQLLLNRFDLG